MIELNTNITVRSMLTSDLSAVSENEAWSYAFPWSQALFEDCLSQPQYHCFVLIARGIDVIGHAILLAGFEEAQLMNLCVHPEYRRQGLAKMLLNHLTTVCKAESLACLLLEVRASNTAAIQLYERYGFSQIGLRKAYYPAKSGREDALLMSIDMPL